MTSDLLILLLLVVVVLTGSALCSGVEAALLTVNPVRVHELAARPGRSPEPDDWLSCASAWDGRSPCW